MRDPAAPRIAAPLGDVETERLRLTRFTAADAAVLAPVFAERAVWEFPYGRGMSAAWTAQFVRRAIEHWNRFGFGLWVARTPADATPIGYLGLSMPSFLADVIEPERMPAVEVGWRLHPAYWGHGLAGEGATAALREAFETLRLDEVCSVPQSINRASSRVAQRIGMRYQRSAVLAPTESRGAVAVDLFWISRQEWVESR